MSAAVYIRRALKYLLSLVILYVAVVWIMVAAGLAEATTMNEIGAILFRTQRGIIVVVAVLLWSFAHPFVGYTMRFVEADPEADRERIINAFMQSGFVLKVERQGEMIFRAAGFMQRLRLLFEDKITVRSDGSGVEINGSRRIVVRVAVRLNTYIQNAKRNEKE